MKKFLTVAFAAVFMLSALNAYNPPVGSEDMCLLSSPKALSGMETTAGGALFSVGPESIAVNPALPAKEQRVDLNAAYTFLYSSVDTNMSQVGSAFQGAIQIPNKLFVFSGYMNGTLIPFNEMQLGNSINGKVGLAKEITDKLSVGLSLSGGYTWSYGKDWALGGNLGFYFKQGDLGFIKDFRYGASVLNLGKNFQNQIAATLSKDSDISAYPTLATVKLGMAGSVLKTDVVNVGLAFDFTTPCFQNLIIDFNTQVSVKDMLVVSLAEKVNLKEAINGYSSFVPSVGVIFTFSFDVKNNQYLESNGWSQSEMTVGAAYKNLYGTVNAGSVGVDINLGMKDTEAPEINIW